MMPHYPVPPHHGRVRITPASAAMVSSARSRDPRLSKMRNPPSATKVGGMQTPSFAMVPPPSNSIRSLPRIPKHTKSSSSTSSRDDREERDPRKRRDRDEKLGGSKSGSSKSSSSSSSLKSSPTSKKFHDSPRKRSEDEKRSSKSSQKTSSSLSRSHSSSKSSNNNGYKSPSEPKDVDLRILTDPNVEDATLPRSMDVDMRPDSTTTPAANSSKLNKNKLLNELLQDEDRSSQDSLISTSYDNGKEQIINLMMTLSPIFLS